MTALTEDKKTEYREGDILGFPVKESQTIYAGAMACSDATGYVLPGGDTSGHIFEGIALRQYDNSSGSSGDLTAELRRRGLFKMTFATEIAVTDLGTAVYIADDNNVDVAGNVTHDIYCGVIAEFIDTTHAWVDITPAIQKSDVTAHIADSSAAHAAEAISVTDAGTFTSETDCEAALQEIYQDLASAAHVIPIPLGSLTGEDGTALTKFTAGATPGFQQLSNKEVVLAWDGNGTPEGVAAVIPFVDPAINDGADVIVHLLAKMAGSTDTPVIAIEAYFGAGDTDCAGTDPEVTATSVTEYTMTIDSGDVPAAPSSLTLVMTPTAGQMDTDELYIYALWLEVTRQLRTA